MLGLARDNTKILAAAMNYLENSDTGFAMTEEQVFWKNVGS